jgi:hypothetical protein
LPIPIVSSVFPALSFTDLKVSGLILRSLIHSEFILVQGDRHGSSFTFLQADSHFPQHYLFKRLSFLHCMVVVPLSKNRVGIAVWVQIQVIYSVPLVFMSVFEPIPCCFLLLWLCSIV